MYGHQYWPIFELKTGNHVGCCGLRPLKTLGNELGFHLIPAYWGKDLAREAARRVIQHGFENLDLGYILAGHHPEHQAVQHLLPTLGFEFVHDELYPPTGLLHRLYKLRRDVWREDSAA